MPRSPHHKLIWSREHRLYELYTQGHLGQRFRPGDGAAWQTWLGKETSLAFQGVSGNLNVYYEARPRGGQYWYAYHTTGQRTRKRYLGRTADVTLVRLEESAQALSGASVPAPLAFGHTRPEAESELMRSAKLSPPRLPISLVMRERLFAHLDEAFSVPLTLLSAPAGWGKTTLISTWASRHSHLVAWLSLDTLDNDLIRFWAAVIAALRTRMRGIGAVVLSMLHSPEHPPPSAI